MLPGLLRCLMLGVVIAVPSLARAAPIAGVRPGHASGMDRILYHDGHRFWAATLPAGPARPIRLPFRPVFVPGAKPGTSGSAWSPDGRWFATDDTNGRLAVSDVRSGWSAVVDRYMIPDGGYNWSPNSRYLAYFEYGPGYLPDHTNPVGLYIWDTRCRCSHRLVRNAGRYIAPIWSHDSTRLLIASLEMYLEASGAETDRYYSVDLHGRVVPLYWGNYAFWSPDDRLVAFRSLVPCNQSCGAALSVMSSHGGKAHRLGLSLSSEPEAEWAREDRGYVVDRWLITADGRPVRKVLPDRRQIAYWLPGGRYALDIPIPGPREPAGRDSLHRTTISLFDLWTGKRSAVLTAQAGSTSWDRNFSMCAGSHAIALMAGDWVRPGQRSRATTVMLFSIQRGHLVRRDFRAPFGQLDPLSFLAHETSLLVGGEKGFGVLDLASRRPRATIVHQLAARGAPMLIEAAGEEPTWNCQG